MKKFQKGDKVSFVDKWSRTLTGTFEEYKMVPWGTGEIEACIVLAEAFGPGNMVRCIVPEGRLRRVS